MYTEEEIEAERQADNVRRMRNEWPWKIGSVRKWSLMLKI